MNLKSDEKFFIINNNDDLILVDEIETFPDVIANKMLYFTGQKFNVNYNGNEINKSARVVVQVSFEIDAVTEL